MSEGIVTKHSSISQVLEDFGNEVLGKLKGNLEIDGAIASGALYQKMDFSAKIMGSTFEFVLDMGVDYWQAVDKGRKPGKEPKFESILEWVNTKATFGGIAPPGKIPFNQIPNIRDKAVRRGLAFVIARKIGEKGTKGNDFYSNVVTDARLDKLKKDLSVAANGDMKTVITDTLKRIK